MSSGDGERNAIPTNADDVPWGTSAIPPGYPQTDPGGSVRASGWADDQIPGHDEFNWLQNLWGAFLVWLRAFAPREWSDVWEGLTETSTTGDVFRVYGDADGPPARDTSIFSVTNPATGTGLVRQTRTDGQWLFYFGGTGDAYMLAISPRDGAKKWEYPIPTGAATAIDADGQYVYYSNDNSGVLGLRVHDRTSGAFIRAGGSDYDHAQLRGNGVYVCGVSPFGASGRIDFYTGLGASVTEVFVDIASIGLQALAVDADKVYVGGLSSGAADVIAYTLSGSPANTWSANLPTTTTLPVNAIETDGNVVYVATDRGTLTAGGSANLFALSPVDGSVVWTADIGGSGVDLRKLAVDHRYIYCIDDSAEIYVCWLRAPAASLIYQDAGPWGDVCCDGVSLSGAAGGVSAIIKRAWFLNDMQEFRRANPANPNRQPFYNLAVPRNTEL